MSMQPIVQAPWWRRHADKMVWALLAAFLLYRFVGPGASQPVSPTLAAARFAPGPTPILIDFSSTR